KSSAYIYILFNLATAEHPGRAHPLFGDRDVRRAATMALDREGMAQSVFNGLAKVPPGPMPQFWSVWSPTIHTLGYDTAQAARLLERRGWRRGAGGVRARGTRRLSFELLVPTTSAARRQYSKIVQQQL